MKRWELKFDGAPSGHVYADTLEAARRAGRAAFKRIHPERDAKGSVRVEKDGEEVASEAAEARRLVNELYEGLRLLPGMEVPAEKLRNVVVLLDAAALGKTVAASGARGGGGDTELQEALEPILELEAAAPALKEKVRELLEWVGLNTGEAARTDVERQIFGVLWSAGLIDLRFNEQAPCVLYEASAYLTRRLTKAGGLLVERFKGAANVDDFRAALQTHGPDAAALAWAFLPGTGGPDPVEVSRPYVRLGSHVVQRALLMRGVGTPDEEVVAFDRALFDTLERLQVWGDGLGRLAESHLDEAQRALLPRTEKRIKDVRKQMAEAAKEQRPVLPADTARRDLVKFLIDQVHRMEDALALLPDRTLRDAFGELVFKDVVFRGAGPYLSQRFGINIDTEVVEGADVQALVGRYKDEPGGPRPRAKTTRIYSVVVPCYTQDGVAIRPASVRTGNYSPG
ncbi:MAG: hypothetical protein AB7N76_00165 [Planctomycetota bacterium]